MIPVTDGYFRELMSELFMGAVLADLPKTMFIVFAVGIGRFFFKGFTRRIDTR